MLLSKHDKEIGISDNYIRQIDTLRCMQIYAQIGGVEVHRCI